jgi:hypothetical protein
MAPASASVEQFLRAIWGDGPGMAELTSIGKNGVKSFPFKYPESITSLISVVPNHNREANVYMGVCLRRDPWPRKTGRMDTKGKEVVEYRGTEENTLSSNLAGWFEIDFTGAGHKSGKTISEEDAKKRLAQLPFKPSIMVKSGGGVQGYFLAKEPIIGEDLWKLKSINKALAIFLGADTASVDLARILRVPGTKNIKYSPSRDCEISYWHPENTYRLDDFDFLPVGDPEKPLFANLTSPTAQGHAQGPSSPAAASGSPPAHRGPAIPVNQPAQIRLAPTIELTEDQISKIGSLFAEIWVEGVRHSFALCFGGLLVNRLVTFESAKRILIRASIQTGADTEKRLKDVNDTYERWHQGANVVGATEMAEIIASGQFPEGFRKKALETLEKIKKLLPKVPPPGKGGGDGDDDDNGAEPDFEIIPPLVKFKSIPARWTATLAMLADGSRLTATVETTILTKFQAFSDAFYEQTNKLLIDIKNTRWKSMLREAGDPLEIETPKEARPEGAIESALDDFLETAHEDPEEGILRVFPGRDDVAQFFKYHALDIFLKNRGERYEKRVVLHHLKSLGWSQIVRRFGPKTAKVWSLKLIEQSGTSGGPVLLPTNGNGNGHGPVNGTAQPVTPAAPEPAEGDPDIFDLGPREEPGSTG